MKLSKRERKEAIATIFEKLSEGKSDEKIAEEMDLETGEVSKLKIKLFEEKAEEFRSKPVEHTFVEFYLFQLKNIKELDGLIKKFDGNSRNLGSIVSAVRARADIFSQIITYGQDCGLVKKIEKSNQTIFGLMLGNLGTSEIRTKIVEQTENIGKLISMFGDEDILALPEPSNLHYGPTLDIESEEKKEKKKRKKKKKKKKKKRIEEDLDLDSKPKKKKKKKIKVLFGEND